MPREDLGGDVLIGGQDPHYDNGFDPEAYNHYHVVLGKEDKLIDANFADMTRTGRLNYYEASELARHIKPKKDAAIIGCNEVFFICNYRHGDFNANRM